MSWEPEKGSAIDRVFRSGRRFAWMIEMEAAERMSIEVLEEDDEERAQYVEMLEQDGRDLLRILDERRVVARHHLFGVRGAACREAERSDRKSKGKHAREREVHGLCPGLEGLEERHTAKSGRRHTYM